jgi:hypothetical protein
LESEEDCLETGRADRCFEVDLLDVMVADGGANYDPFFIFFLINNNNKIRLCCF